MVFTRDYLLRVTAPKAGAKKRAKSQRNNIHRRDITGFLVISPPEESPKNPQYIS